MKKLLFALLLLPALSGCEKTDDACKTVTITAPASEVDQLRQWLANNNITATEDSRGFFYTIGNAGDANKPMPCNDVTVSYIGRLTNGMTFDQASNISFNLNRLITGWKEGLPLIGKGGAITLYLPPSLGYGNQSSGSIPPNSITIFDITLHNVL